MADIQVGDRVRVLVDTPENTPIDGTVVLVQDIPGKHIGVELDNFAPGGHTLDGELDEKEKTDSVSGVTYGKGWFTREENVEVL
jgi:hypothetical protein